MQANLCESYEDQGGVHGGSLWNHRDLLASRRWLAGRLSLGILSGIPLGFSLWGLPQGFLWDSLRDCSQRLFSGTVLRDFSGTVLKLFSGTVLRAEEEEED